ncbi:MAG: HlyC/CorC family transporter [Candidatus Aminicenantes bacterium]|nr:HlyC/CorC family transporter [Candidatus Aminicenantes bacterium]
MVFLIFFLLFSTTVLYYLFEVSFKSFSRISLAGLLEDIQSNWISKFDFIAKYDLVLNSLSAFSYFLQLTLFIYSFFLMERYLYNPIHRIALLIFSFLVTFNFLLYTIAYLNREAIIKRLIFLYPIPWVFFYPANLIFSFFLGRNPENKDPNPDDLSEKELEVFIEEGTKEGLIESEDKEMITSILEFGDTLVKEIMTPRVDMIYVPINIGLNQLVALINNKKKSRYPVISGRVDNIEGIILSKDVFNYLDKPDFNIKMIIRKAFLIPETMRILELLKALQKSKQKFAIVVDEFGGVSGLVTMEDIIEEIVGEIQDEYDEDIEQIKKEKDHFIVNGDTDIVELGETLNIKFDEEEDYQTVAGFISYKLGRIPNKMDKITLENHTLQVIDIEKNRIKKVKITVQNK